MLHWAFEDLDKESASNLVLNKLETWLDLTWLGLTAVIGLECWLICLFCKKNIRQLHFQSSVALLSQVVTLKLLHAWHVIWAGMLTTWLTWFETANFVELKYSLTTLKFDSDTSAESKHNSKLSLSTLRLECLIAWLGWLDFQKFELKLVQIACQTRQLTWSKLLTKFARL